MLTLPQIVRQIREQQPEAVSEWFACNNHPTDGPLYGIVDEKIVAYIHEPAAIRIVEADLWRLYCDDRREDSVYAGVRVDGGGWPSAFRGDGYDIVNFDPADPLSLIRALCHAVGITLKEEA
jgi:hypothetical protein